MKIYAELWHSIPKSVCRDITCIATSADMSGMLTHPGRFTLIRTSTLSGRILRQRSGDGSLNERRHVEHPALYLGYKRNRYVGPLSSFDKGMGFTLRCVKDLE